MSLKTLEVELDKAKAIIPKLQPFWQDRLADLPEDLRKELNRIGIIPQFTKAGIEPIANILIILYIAEIIAEKCLKEGQKAV